MNSIKLKIEDVTLHAITSLSEWDSNNTAVIFLHGFTGCADDWQFIFNELPKPFFGIAIDLVGHGKSDSPSDMKYYTEDFQIHLFNTFIKKLNITNPIIAGYSMGGRLALSYSIKFPDKVSALILESSTAGISENDMREERIKADFSLAERIIIDGVENFIDYWLSLPLFSNLSKLEEKYFSKIRTRKLDNDPIGLANTLKNFGTGKMNSYWNQLSSIKMNTLLITGELDDKFSYLNEKMKLKIPNAVHREIKNSGHNTHLEKPNEFIILIQSFLNSLIK